MKVFQDLEIRGSPSEFNKLIEMIETKLNDGWTRDREAENRSAETGSRDMFCYSCVKQKERAAASLWLAIKDKNVLYVPNIVPTLEHKLSLEDYNFILREFYTKFVRDPARQLHLETTLTSDSQDLEDWVSRETAEKLRLFSRAANKSTGSAHSLDQQRWFDFLVVAHEDSWRLDPYTLQRWLIECEGWSEDVAFDLLLEYEFARALLRFYDKNR